VFAACLAVVCSLTCCRWGCWLVLLALSCCVAVACVLCSLCCFLLLLRWGWLDFSSCVPASGAQPRWCNGATVQPLRPSTEISSLLPATTLENLKFDF
jgi:hypothetical protein